MADPDFAHFMAYIQSAGYDVNERGNIEERVTTYCLDDTFEEELGEFQLPVEDVTADLEADDLLDQFPSNLSAVDDYETGLKRVVRQGCNISAAEPEAVKLRPWVNHDPHYSDTTLLGVFESNHHKAITDANTTAHDEVEACAAYAAFQGGRSGNRGRFNYGYRAAGVEDGQAVYEFTAHANRGDTVAKLQLHTHNQGPSPGYTLHTLRVKECNHRDAPVALVAMGEALVCAINTKQMSIRDRQDVTVPYMDYVVSPRRPATAFVIPELLKRHNISAHQMWASMAAEVVNVIVTDDTGSACEYRRPAADVTGGVLTSYARSGFKPDAYGLRVTTTDGKYDTLFVGSNSELPSLRNKVIVDATPACSESSRNTMSATGGVYKVTEEGVDAVCVRSALMGEGTTTVRVLEPYHAVRTLLGMADMSMIQARVSSQPGTTSVVLSEGARRKRIVVERASRSVAEGMYAVCMGKLPTGLKLPRKCRHMSPLALLAELSVVGDKADPSLPASTDLPTLDMATELAGSRDDPKRRLAYIRLNGEAQYLAGVYIHSRKRRGKLVMADLQRLIRHSVNGGVPVRWLSKPQAELAAVAGAQVSSLVTGCREQSPRAAKLMMLRGQHDSPNYLSLARLYDKAIANSRLPNNLVGRRRDSACEMSGALPGDRRNFRSTPIAQSGGVREITLPLTGVHVDSTVATLTNLQHFMANRQ